LWDPVKKQVGIYLSYNHVIFWNGSSGSQTHPSGGGRGGGGVFCPLVCVFCPLVHVFVKPTLTNRNSIASKI
jgi:hypothetical protein